MRWALAWSFCDDVIVPVSLCMFSFCPQSRKSSSPAAHLVKFSSFWCFLLYLDTTNPSNVVCQYQVSNLSSIDHYSCSAGEVSKTSSGLCPDWLLFIPGPVLFVTITCSLLGDVCDFYHAVSRQQLPGLLDLEGNAKQGPWKQPKWWAAEIRLLLLLWQSGNANRGRRLQVQQPMTRPTVFCLGSLLFWSFRQESSQAGRLAHIFLCDPPPSLLN